MNRDENLIPRLVSNLLGVQMSGLKSDLFSGDERLEKCLIEDAAHVIKGNKGEFVGKIQFAVLVLQRGSIQISEIQQMLYGDQTADMILAFKTQRKIINTNYQQTADNIVGKMTIRSLDDGMVEFEKQQRELNDLNRRSLR